MSHSSYVATSSACDRHQHLLGHAERRLVAVQLLEDAVDETSRREVFDLVDDEALAADDSALADEEDLHRRFELVVGDADDVDVLVAIGHHLLLLDRPVHGSQPVAHPRRPLVLQRRSAAARISASRRLTISSVSPSRKSHSSLTSCR